MNVDNCAERPEPLGSVIPTSHRLPASTLQQKFRHVESPHRRIYGAQSIMFIGFFRTGTDTIEPGSFRVEPRHRVHPPGGGASPQPSTSSSPNFYTEYGPGLSMDAAVNCSR
jgi:hypothetical protein